MLQAPWKFGIMICRLLSGNEGNLLELDLLFSDGNETEQFCLELLRKGKREKVGVFSHFMDEDLKYLHD